MRLFLAASGTLDDPGRLVRLVGRDRTGLVCADALDHEDPGVRARAVRDETALLRGWGLRASELDLRAETPMTVAERLLAAGFVWVTGGNVFVLRRAMGACGLDQLLPQLLARDGIVYAGHGAGAAVLAPDLAGLEAGDDPAPAVALYGEASSTRGLGVLDRPFLSAEAPGLAGVAAEHARRGEPFWELRDGQALVVDGRRVEAPGAR